MEKEILERLAAKFPDRLVRTRRGAFNKPIRYLPTAAIIERLNSVLEGQWSFTVIRAEQLEGGEVQVLGRLDTSGVIRECFGRAQPVVARESGEVVSLGDSFKSAASDSLKKCAATLGIGAYLYLEDIIVQPEETPAQNNPDRPVKAASDARERLTAKQLQAIWSLGRTLKVNAETLRNRSVEMFGAQPEQLAKSDASLLISKLGEEIDKRRAA